jgi:hypothetical protein
MALRDRQKYTMQNVEKGSFPRACCCVLKGFDCSVLAVVAGMEAGWKSNIKLASPPNWLRGFSVSAEQAD